MGQHPILPVCDLRGVLCVADVTCLSRQRLGQPNGTFIVLADDVETHESQSVRR